jgi:hypothetical protein
MGAVMKRATFYPNGADLAKHPCIIRLLANGTIRIQDGEYVGRAADGVEVNLGVVGFEDACERYLSTVPQEKW